MSDGSPPSPGLGPTSGVVMAYAMLALTMTFWAGNSIVARAVQHEVPPLTLALMRWTGALAVLTPFALPGLMGEWRAVLRAWRPILLLGFLGVACFNAFLYSGLHHTTATNALLLQAGVPALVLCADLALFRVRPDAASIVGVALSMIGVVLIVFRGDLAAIAASSLNQGDLLVLAGVACWALYTSLLRLRPAIRPLSFLIATFAIGAVGMAPLAGWEWAHGARIDWSPRTAMAVGYVAILPSVIGYGLFNAAATRLGSGPAGQAINLMPVFGALLAALLLGEALHGYHLAGMALVLTGIGLPLAVRWRAARLRG